MSPTDPWCVSLYWGNRAESFDEASGRLRAAIDAIASLDERFSSWFVEDDFRGRPVLWDIRGESPLVASKLAGVPSSIVLGEEAVSVTSSTVKLVNGREGEGAAEMVLSYGLDRVPAGMWFPNSFALTFHASPLDPMLDPPVAKDLVAASARHMDALGGAFLPSAHARRHGNDLFEGRITAGWLTFLAERLGPLPPPLALLTTSANGGNIVQLTSRLFSANDERQIVAADEVGRVLGQWGRLTSAGKLLLGDPVPDE